MSEYPELKNCPFCGASEWREDRSQQLSAGNKAVYCFKCGCAGPKKHKKGDAIAAWNTRAGGK